MGYFDKGLFEFLSGLSEHNERAWFTANKQRYEQDVKEPFLDFISDAGPRLHKISRKPGGEPAAGRGLAVPHLSRRSLLE
ncbi:MAG TPA: DUF2461 family protein [Actinomycetota bacterium]